MRILLINPLYGVTIEPLRVGQPLGLAYVAASLRRDGHSVRMVDANCPSVIPTEAHFWRATFREPADLIGISTYSVNWNSAALVARQCKWGFPTATVVVGGHHASILHEQLVGDYVEIDGAVRGEGDVTLCEVAYRLERGQSVNGVPGFTVRSHGSVVAGPGRSPVEKLDDLPMPARDLLPDLVAYGVVGPYGGLAAEINSSRGCPHRCAFCSIAVQSLNVEKTPLWRARSPENVVEEVGWLHSRHGVAHFTFNDADFLVSVDRAVAIAEGVQRVARGATFAFGCRADDIRRAKNVLGTLARLGCTHVELGLENFDDGELSHLNKGVAASVGLEALNLLKDAGVHALPSFILTSDVTLPGQYIRNIEIIRQLGLPGGVKLAWLFTFMEPLPGTPLRQRLESHSRVGSATVASPYYSVRSEMRSLWGFLAMTRRSLYPRMQSILDRTRVHSKRRFVVSRRAACRSYAEAQCIAIGEALVTRVYQAVRRVAEANAATPDLVHEELWALDEFVSGLEADLENSSRPASVPNVPTDANSMVARDISGCAE